MEKAPSPFPSPAPPGHAMAITGLGMVSSLGASAVASCAAARAGLTRWTELELQVSDEDSMEDEPLRGHAARELTCGFEGVGRLVRLGEAALGDLVEPTELSSPASRTALLLCLPGDFHEKELLERELAAVADRALRRRLWTEAQASMEGERERLEHQVLPRLLALQSLDVPAQWRQCFFGGPAVVVKAVLRAAELLGSRQVERCVVGGIDSWVHGLPLRRAQALGLLRTPSAATGFFPGEAAAFVLLERLDTARFRKATVEGVVLAAAGAQEPFHRFSRVTPGGAALAEAIGTCAAQVGGGLAETRLAIINLNGDDFRAMDFGNTLVRLGMAGLPRDFRQWYPPECFGELGAATGPVALCMAARGFARGYAGTRRVLVGLLADDEARGAMLLEEPGPQERGV